MSREATLFEDDLGPKREFVVQLKRDGNLVTTIITEDRAKAEDAARGWREGTYDFLVD